jgi:hypothetical protein
MSRISQGRNGIDVYVSSAEESNVGDICDDYLLLFFDDRHGRWSMVDEPMSVE